MNTQNFGEPINPSDHEDQTGQVANRPVLNPDPAAADPVAEKIVPEAPARETASYAAPASESAASPASFLSLEESEQLCTRWNEIQGMFVDEPRASVQKADELVSEVVQKITRILESEHSSLESQWKQENNASTEDLRKALQNYRAFFNRLVD